MNWVPKQAAGPEYDVLRLLPARQQRRIWAACYQRASQDPRCGVALVGLTTAGMVTFFAVDTALAAILGGRRIWARLISDFLTFHVILHPLYRMWSNYLAERARPFVREELAKILDGEQYQFLVEAASDSDSDVLSAVRAAAGGHR